jgi:hypothetical protein
MQDILVQAIVGGIVGLISTKLPFVKSMGLEGKLSAMIGNVVAGAVGGPIGAAVVGNPDFITKLLSGDVAGSLTGIAGALVGAGGLSTLVATVLGQIKK